MPKQKKNKEKAAKVRDLKPVKDPKGGFVGFKTSGSGPGRGRG
jgi:hypothetical protein